MNIILDNILHSYYRNAKNNDDYVLENINIKINENKTTCILGKNGNGKSTLLKIIANIIKPSKGYVLLESNSNNLDISKINIKEYSKYISYLPQRFDMFDSMDVLDYVVTGKYNTKRLHEKYSGNDYKEAIDILDQIDIIHLANKDMMSISGGELQKVLLSKVFLQNAEIILLDEPFNNLDRESITEILKIIKKINKSGKTVIISMHELEIAINHFDELIYLENKNVKFSGNRVSFVNELKEGNIINNINIFEYDGKYYLK